MFAFPLFSAAIVVVSLSLLLSCCCCRCRLAYAGILSLIRHCGNNVGGGCCMGVDVIRNGLVVGGESNERKMGYDTCL